MTGREAGDRGRSSLVISSASPRDTQRVGAALAVSAGRGAVISLEGGLGAGKTCLVKGMADGLGIDAEVLSPTFILVEEYRGGGNTLMHYDLYRLEELGEVESIGFFDAIDGENVVVVEWGDRLPGAEELFDLRVRIDITGSQAREIRIYGREDLVEAVGAVSRSTGGSGEPDDPDGG